MKAPYGVLITVTAGVAKWNFGRPGTAYRLAHQHILLRAAVEDCVSVRDLHERTRIQLWGTYRAANGTFMSGFALDCECDAIGSLGFDLKVGCTDDVTLVH